MTITLLRLWPSNHGTFGRLIAPGFKCYTIELPWRDNQRNISCIPAGSYQVIYCYSPHFKRRLYLIDNVPGRSGVRLHPGNVAGDVKQGLRTHSLGCILPGLKVGTLYGQRCVARSETAHRRLLMALDRQDFTLEIEEVFK